MARQRGRTQSVDMRGPTAVMPGEAVALSTGAVVMVRPWGMRAITHEVPALLARIATNVRGIPGVLDGDREAIMENLPQIIGVASQEVADLVAFSVGIPRDEIEATLSAEDYLMLAVAVWRQNEGFFKRLAVEVRRRRAVAEAGSRSPATSSVEDSG